MHIPEGALSPVTYGAAYAVMTPLWLIAGRQLTRRLRARQVPLLAMGATFSFVIMFFNLPAFGTVGHAIGAALIAILLGPWAALLALSLVLAVQAFFFQDGGITALGANCFNLAFLSSFTGYTVFRLFTLGQASRRRRIFAAGAAGYLSITMAALGTALLLGIQPLVGHAADGRPLYFPLGVEWSLAGLVIPHLALFGFLEAGVTAAAYAFLLRTEPALLAPQEASHAP